MSDPGGSSGGSVISVVFYGKITTGGNSTSKHLKIAKSNEAGKYETDFRKNKNYLTVAL